MKIATRIRLSAVLAVMIATAAGIVLLVGLRAVDSATDRGNRITESLNRVFGLSLLANDYALTHQLDAEDEWDTGYAELSALIDQIEVTTEGDEALLARVEKNLAQADSVFHEFEDGHLQVVSGEVDPAAAWDHELRLTTRFLGLIEAATSDAVVLRQHASAEAIEAQDATIIVVLSVSALGVLAMGVIGLSADRSIIRPLEALRQAASSVGHGNLDVRSGISSSDEVGEFASTFDSMIESLENSYAMIEAEVVERRRAERRLSEYRDHLEQTVRERTREIIAVNEDLQRATHAKDDFLASMSHELRTPLNSVIGFTDLMLKGRTGDFTGEQLRQIRMVHEAGRQLLGLVNEVLELSRIDAGALPISPVPFDPAEAVGRLLEMMAPVAERKNLALSWRAEEGTPAEIISDRGRVDQIMLNLLGNAIKFTESGSVDVTIRPDGGHHVAFDVHDTGVGIPSEEFAAIFEHFHQVPTTPAPEGGTGLGLSISQRLADVLGGEVTVASEVGAGSTFTLRLPVVHPSAEAATMTLAPEPGD